MEIITVAAGVMVVVAAATMAELTQQTGLEKILEIIVTVVHLGQTKIKLKMSLLKQVFDQEMVKL